MNIIRILLTCLAVVATFLAPSLPSAAAPASVVDASTLTGKVLCGYQGWFAAPNDGSHRDFAHWGFGTLSPGTAAIDFWPDMTEYPQSDRYLSGFTGADGNPAPVFSAFNPATEGLHFKWMRDYGIDGVFVQRFTSQFSAPVLQTFVDTVLDNCKSSAGKYGRVYAVMYDLSGRHNGDTQCVIDDWKHLVDTRRLTKDDRYIHNHGRPVVALWGIGIDGRDALFDDALKLIDFLHNDPVYGGNDVMIGVQVNWLFKNSAAEPLAKMLQVAQAADIVSPWSVGTIRTPEQAAQMVAGRLSPDRAWCTAHGREYMPVVFPGFSWHNLFKGARPVNQIPRLGGRFLWSQYVAARAAGCTMVYQAMFDEVNEGTAIFKCTNTPPDGKGLSEFATYEGLPSDFYLKLVGEGTRLIRGDIQPQDENLIGR